MSQGDAKLHDVIVGLDRIAERRHGLVTTDQLRELGLNAKDVHRYVVVDVIVPVRHLIYRVGGAPQSWEQTVLAAVLGAGSGAVASHSTAAALWSLKHSDRFTAGLHVTAPRQVRMRGVVGHQGRISPGECTVCRAIPVTTPERTILDLASILQPRPLAECVDDALRRGLIRLDRLRSVVAQAARPGHGRRKVAPLHQVLADRLPGYRPGDSDWEQEMDRQWDLLGLPTGVRQFRVKAAGRMYRIDRAIPELKIGVEWDGFEVHATRSAFDYGSDRQADLAAEGWLMLHFTSNSDPTRIARAVRRAVDDRSPQPQAKPAPQARPSRA